MAVSPVLRGHNSEDLSRFVERPMLGYNKIAIKR